MTFVNASSYLRAHIDKDTGSLDRSLDSRRLFFVEEFQINFERCQCRNLGMPWLRIEHPRRQSIAVYPIDLDGDVKIAVLAKIIACATAKK